MATDEFLSRPLEEWLAQALRGDESAAAALYGRFSPPVLRLCLGLLENLQDAEEVAQDTFVYALRNLARFDGRKSAFATWLFTIAVSRCRNKRRRKWRDVLPLEWLRGQAQAGDDREVEAALARRGVRRQVWRALQALPAHQREAVALRFLAEMRYREIGTVLGCNAKTAESRVRLGLAAMRAWLLAQQPAAGVEAAELGLW
jgi:RNA polymerase sigma-70 factor (ECF subfamily)